MLLKLILLFLLPTVVMAQNTKPLIVTDNGSNTCNATRMVVSSGSLSCSGSVATVTTGGGGGASLWEVNNVGIDTFSNVGIGSTNPGAKLDINGTSRMNGFSMPNGASNTFVLTSDSSGNGTWQAATGGTGTNFWLNTAATGNVGVSTSNSVGIGTATGNGVLVVMGNVGIGTINPTAAFSISPNNAGSTFSITSGGTVAATGSVRGTQFIDGNNTNTFADPSGTSVMTAMQLSSTLYALGNVGIGTSNAVQSLSIAGNIGIGTVKDGDNFLTTTPPNGGIIVEGNIGIGSLAPGNALDINGTGRMTGFTLTGQGASSGFTIVGSSVGVGTWMNPTTQAGSIASFTTTGTSGASTYTGGVLNIPQYSTTASPAGSSPQLQYNNAGSLGAITSGGTDGTNVGIGTVSFVNRLNIVGNVGISTLANSPFVTLNVASPNALVVEGNVGIGTWGPLSLFHVKGAGGSAVVFDLGATSPIAFVRDASSTTFNGISLVNSSSDTANIAIFGGGDNHMYFQAKSTGGFQFRPNGANTVKMLLDANGNLGIGQTSIPNKLSVTGDAGFTGNIGLGTVGNGVARLQVVGNVGIGTVSNGDNFLTTIPPAGGMIVEGNVGIGTINPGQSLDVNGTVRAGNFVATSLTASKVVLTDANKQFSSATNLQDLAYCQTGGTNCPGSITGFANPTATVSTAAVNGSATTAMRSDGAPAIDLTMTPTWTGKHIFNNSTTAFTSGAGNVGINSATPGAQLDVNGTARVTGFTLTGQGAATGNVMVTNAVGVGTWMASTTLNVTATVTPGGAVPTLQYNNNGVLGGILGSGADANGNLGIGTSAPVQKLAVVGNVGIGTKSYSTYITTTPTASGLVTEGNIGIGTWKIDNAALAIMNGNLGIGTWVTDGGSLIIKSTGNVGIGTIRPGTVLDVNGTDRMTGFTLTGQGASSGYVIVGNALGVGTWMAPSTIPATAAPAGSSPQLQYNNAGSMGAITSGGTDGTNIGIGTVSFVNRLNIVGNVGISTLTNSPFVTLNVASPNALVVEGNVGIGTWGPLKPLSVKGDTYLNGNIGLGTTLTTTSSLTVMNGNVGIGSWAPEFPLQIRGNVGIGTSATQSAPAYAITINNVATFNSEFQIAANIGVGTTNVNWNNGVYQNVGIGTNGTNTYITFTHPTNGNLAKIQLRMLEDATGSRALPFWPATVLWSGGTIPTLSGAAKSDIINCTWNGAKDYCSSTLNF